MRVLLVEDEKKLARFVHKALHEAGYAVDEVHDGDSALALALRTPYDAIVMDIMLPGRDGLSVLKLMRERRVISPVLFLTARGQVSERIEGLELGADDYMSKPFAMRELLARLAGLMRRASPDKGVSLAVGDLTMNLLTRQVMRGRRSIRLAQREFSLLEFLMRYPGRIHSRTSLCEHVWEYHFDTGINVVDVYIKRLRAKIEEANEPRLLHTERGVGYYLRAAE